MPPQRLANSSMGYRSAPEALKATSEAFDAAWAEIASNFGDDRRI
jgi:hypothetical protein